MRKDSCDSPQQLSHRLQLGFQTNSLSIPLHQTTQTLSGSLSATNGEKVSFLKVPSLFLPLFNL